MYHMGNAIAVRASPFARFCDEILEQVEFQLVGGDAAAMKPKPMPGGPTSTRTIAPPDGAGASEPERPGNAGVLSAPIVVVGAFDPEAIVNVPRQARRPVPIAPYEEMLFDPDERLLVEEVPSPFLAAPAWPQPALPPAPEPPSPVVFDRAAEAPADRTYAGWDADAELDEVIQEWFEKPVPAPPVDMSPEITLH